MGGSSSSSKHEQTENIETNTITTTTTETNIGDIGLTGSDAVALADILQAGSIQSQRIQAEALTKISQDIGSSWQQLVGGAGLIATTAGEQSGKLLDTAKSIANPDTEQSSNIVKVVLGIAAVGGAYMLIRKKRG
jgi:hypothetical protein